MCIDAGNKQPRARATIYFKTHFNASHCALVCLLSAVAWEQSAVVHSVGFLFYTIIFNEYQQSRIEDPFETKMQT